MLIQDARPHTVAESALRLALPILAIASSVLTIRPLGFTGVGGLSLVLLVVNSAFSFSRSVSTGTFSPRTDLVLMISWGVCAAALLSLDSQSSAAAFAYLAAGRAGYLLSTRAGLSVAVGTAALSSLGLWLMSQHHSDVWPWPLGLTVALPVFIGLSNSSRDSAIASALAAAEAGRRAAEAEARVGTLAERARISRDIHDVLAHTLSGVSMQLELSEMMLDRDKISQAREAIGKAHSMVREGMAEARRAVQDSRDQVLPLAETLTALFQGSCEPEIVGPVRTLDTTVAQTLIRSAQESLTNVRRHAPGADLEVRLTFRTADVALEISNGPAGKEVGNPEGSGMGLVGMRERAALLGGRVETGPIGEGRFSGGWRVQVVLPG